jgi:hypothetical protein
VAVVAYQNWPRQTVVVMEDAERVQAALKALAQKSRYAKNRDEGRMRQRARLRNIPGKARAG